MALVERLMGEPYCLPSEKIPVHDFVAAQVEVTNGRLTRAKIKAFLAMDAATQTEYDTLANLAPGAAAALSNWLHGVQSIFILAEKRYPEYSTPAEVRGKLGI